MISGKSEKGVASGTPTKADKATKKLIMEKIDYEGDDSEGNDSEPGNYVESMEEEETSDLSTIVQQVVENAGIGNSSKASSHNQLVKEAEKAILNLLPTIVQAIATGYCGGNRRENGRTIQCYGRKNRKTRT